MPIIEDLGGNGGRTPAPKQDPKPKLTKWDDGPVLAQANPAPRPQPSPLAGTAFDPSRLKQLTPFTLPVEEPQRAGVTEEPERTAVSFTPGDPRVGLGSVPQGYASHPMNVTGSAGAPAPAEEPRPQAARTKTSTGDVYKLDWDEYNKLDKDQRAAVDFNTMLVQAREKDLNTDYSKVQNAGANAEYDAAVERMFGENGGSETFAPETMAVLRSIDFKGSGETLDDFLNLNAAVSAKELKDFEIKPVEASVMFQDGSVAASGALLGQTQAAAQTEKLIETMAKAGQLIQNFRSSAAVNRSPLSVRYGGVANQAAPALGFGDDEDSKYFRMAADALSRDLTPADLEQVWGALNAKYGPEKLTAFKKFADDITRDAISFQPPEWATAEGVNFNPQLIRERLGLDQGGQ